MFALGLLGPPAVHVSVTSLPWSRGRWRWWWWRCCSSRGAVPALLLSWVPAQQQLWQCHQPPQAAGASISVLTCLGPGDQRPCPALTGGAQLAEPGGNCPRTAAPVTPGLAKGNKGMKWEGVKQKPYTATETAEPSGPHLPSRPSPADWIQRQATHLLHSRD